VTIDTSNKISSLISSVSRNPSFLLVRRIYVTFMLWKFWEWGEDILKRGKGQHSRYSLGSSAGRAVNNQDSVQESS